MVGPLRLVDTDQREPVVMTPRSGEGPCFGMDFKQLDGICGVVAGIDADGPYVSLLDALGQVTLMCRLDWSVVIGEAIRARSSRT